MQTILCILLVTFHLHIYNAALFVVRELNVWAGCSYESQISALCENIYFGNNDLNTSTGF